MIPREHAASGARRWWLDLQPDPGASRAGDRAALARLRRCTTVAEAMQEPSALMLFQAVKATGPDDLVVVALAAAVLAHVRRNDDAPGTSVARLVGPGSIETPETALLKPLRFRRLMEADTPDERLQAFRRLVALAGGALPVRDLAAALLDWSDWRRTRWIYQYWNALPPAPASATPAASTKDATP